MLWRIVVGVVKAALAVALFAMVGRTIELTGLQVGLINPLAGLIASVTGLSARHAEYILIGLIAYGLARVVSGACDCLSSSINRVPQHPSIHSQQ
ncbi:MAG: hypothetical protein C5B51_22855 [Terriglobia bacterium]|nr:MAG: hypothetical protein C5B51_22855 [Terriglobia bacterium]